MRPTNSMVARLLATVLLALSACAPTIPAPEIYSQFQGAPKVDGKFQNEVGPWQVNLSGAMEAFWKTEQYDNRPDGPIPLRTVDTRKLEQESEAVIVRLGHSTVLIKLGEQYVLTDPMFSERASPFAWFGPKRFHPPPMKIEELPNLKAVVISHDHYDHLDKQSIVALVEKVEHFVVPLGVGSHLRKWGVPDASIIELDWWEEVQVGKITLAATPSQHLSGRGLFDRNKTLWASWVIIDDNTRIYFSGDSGYFPGFRDIGGRYGPFDITLIENGAYNCAWRDIHMMPEDSIQAHLDLGGHVMMPIHNSTFDLALHPWYEPLERVTALAAEQGIEVATPTLGAAYTVHESIKTYAWWRDCCKSLTTIAESLPDTSAMAR
ncbi:MAG: MBL fold metallo-hydrolase [Pseudomonadota bacterium]